MANMMQRTGASLLPAGTTPGEVTLGRVHATGVFVLNMDASEGNKENRWSLEFGRAVHKAFDCIEATLAADPPNTPAALLTTSGSDKFYSNGIDPTVLTNVTGDEMAQWNDTIMPCFARPILLPIPTVTAINGHAFGAGMMFALGHDTRLQRQERGYQCAVEVAIGIKTPSPELTLFRHSMSASAFHETTILAKRWSGDDALRAGIVSGSVPGADLLRVAMETAVQQSKLGANRKVMRYYKRELKGFVADEILAWEFPDAKPKGSAPLSAGLQRHVDAWEEQARASTWGQRFRDFENAEEKRRLYGSKL